MRSLDEVLQLEQPIVPADKLPVSVIVPARNEARNLPRCLESLRNAGEIYVIDSGSTDETVEIARSYGAKVVQFHYQGGWPKKRQWAMDSLPLQFEWVLLLDADESLTPALTQEIARAIQDSQCDGYYLELEMYFLGRQLRFCGANFYKLSLFKRGKGHYECRLRQQDSSMCDMEVHEHIVVDGSVKRLRNPIVHHNVESLSRYILKHNQYSNWESQVWMNAGASMLELPPSPVGSQAQRRRWLKKKFLSVPGSSLLFFLYKYFFRLGILDGVPGLIFCAFQGFQVFSTKAKIYELKLNRS